MSTRIFFIVFNIFILMNFNRRWYFYGWERSQNETDHSHQRKRFNIFILFLYSASFFKLPYISKFISLFLVRFFSLSEIRWICSFAAIVGNETENATLNYNNWILYNCIHIWATNDKWYGCECAQKHKPTKLAKCTHVISMNVWL